MARPTKLTKELSEKICRAIRAGNYPAVAAMSAGVSESTFYRWMEEGRNSEKGKYRDFYEEIKQAEAEGEAFAVATVASAAPLDWRAAMAILERRWAANWLRRTGTTIPPAPEERQVVDLSKLTEEQIRALEEINARLADTD